MQETIAFIMISTDLSANSNFLMWDWANDLLERMLYSYYSFASTNKLNFYLVFMVLKWVLVYKFIVFMKSNFGMADNQIEYLLSWQQLNLESQFNLHCIWFLYHTSQFFIVNFVWDLRDYKCSKKLHHFQGTKLLLSSWVTTLT